MELSSEDSLRLNVLIHQDLHAVRIDESKMVVYALTQCGEARVPLNPTCRDDKYLRMVREMFSTHALGSPGGYPVYLRRWTRMGQMREDSLQGLLLLGEPEAIVAVANSPHLSEEVAHRAWWAMPDADIARRMLRNPRIAASGIGKELAVFLLEYLPFENEAFDIAESVRLVLQPGLVDDSTIRSLWSRANRKSVFYVGFLLANPESLPEQMPASSRFEASKSKLESLCGENPYAKLLMQLLSAQGQVYLSTISRTLDKLSDQHVVVLFLKAIQNYFRDVCIVPDPRYRTFDAIAAAVDEVLNNNGNTGLKTLLENFPEYHDSVYAMLSLACVCEALVDPIFSQTDAVGSVMRKRLQSVTQPIAENIQRLM
ncbi:MAG TPA: sulfur reduction protein DsrS [Gammaproteobacteria bacterium]